MNTLYLNKSKQIVFSILKNLIFSGYSFSFGALLLYIISTKIGQQEFSSFYGFTIFLLTQSTYYLDRLLFLAIDKSTNLNRSVVLLDSFKIHLFLFLIQVLCLLTAIFYIENNGIKILIIATIIIGASYGILLKNITKKIPFFKNIVVSLAWLSPLIFVYILSPSKTEDVIIIFAIYLFIQNFVLQILLDFKDVQEDKTQKLKTMPVLYGKKNSYNVSIALILVSIIIISWSIYLYLIPLYFYSLVIIGIVELLGLQILKHNKKILSQKYLSFFSIIMSATLYFSYELIS